MMKMKMQTGMTTRSPSAAAESPSTEIKAILDVLDTERLFTEDMIPFFRWIADYYIYPLGEVIKGALPGGLNLCVCFCICFR